MKKAYIIPETQTLRISVERIMVGSNDIISSGDVTGIMYGGVTDGSVSPEAKRSYDVWEEDWSK